MDLGRSGGREGKLWFECSVQEKNLISLGGEGGEVGCVQRSELFTERVFIAAQSGEKDCGKRENQLMQTRGNLKTHEGRSPELNKKLRKQQKFKYPDSRNEWKAS